MLWSESLQSLSALYTRSIRLMMGIAEKVCLRADALWDDGWPGRRMAAETNFYIRKLRKKDGKSL
jgi:hypothetical protein